MLGGCHVVLERAPKARTRVLRHRGALAGLMGGVWSAHLYDLDELGNERAPVEGLLADHLEEPAVKSVFRAGWKREGKIWYNTPSTPALLRLENARKAVHCGTGVITTSLQVASETGRHCCERERAPLETHRPSQAGRLGLIAASCSPISVR